MTQLLKIKEQKKLEKQTLQQKKHGQILRVKRKRKSYYSEEVSESDDDEGEDDDDDEEDNQNRDLLDQDDEIKEIKRKFKVPRNVWIIKPGENTNRGNGINVSSNLNEIKSLVSKSGSNNTKEKTIIIQKYLDYPLLINNRKFDFRCYGVMTSVNGFLKGYFYDDAYIRTSCKEFDIENLHNKFIHLTNDAVQKKSDDYGKFENGNKMSLQDFQRYLKITYPDLKIDIFRHIMPQIKKLVTDTYRAAYGKIDPARLYNTFEIFGYDFMLDQDFQLYLIEVNTNPCLEMSCPLLARIIPELLDNSFKIILDPVFPSPDLTSNKKCQSNEIPQEFRFSLVFDETIDGPVLDKIKNISANNIQNTNNNNNNESAQFGAIKEEIESDEEEEQDDEQEKSGNGQ